MKRRHGANQTVYECSICDATFVNIVDLCKHRETHRPDTGYSIIETAFGEHVVTYQKIHGCHSIPTLSVFFRNNSGEIVKVIQYEAARKKVVKVGLVVTATFTQKKDGTEGEEQDNIRFDFRTPNATLHQQDDPMVFLQETEETFQARCDDFINKGSGWVLEHILVSRIMFVSTKLLQGGCGDTVVEKTGRKERDSSVAGDNQCFFRSVAYHYTKDENSDVLQQFMSEHMDTTISTPVKVRDIPQFERLNPQLDLSINIIVREGSDTYPSHVSKGKGKQKMTLLLTQTGTVQGLDEQAAYHYTYIKDISKFAARSYQSHGARRSYEKCSVCPNCLNKFSGQESYARHFETCVNNKPAKTEMPPPGSVIEFKNYKNKFIVPITGFVDFESVMTAPNRKCERCLPEEKCSHSTLVEEYQTPMSYSLVFLDHNNDIIHSTHYIGEDAADHLVEELLTLSPEFDKVLAIHEPMVITKEEEKQFKLIRDCHICDKPLGEDRVRDHDHITGIYIGPAHNECNLHRTVCRKIPIYAHNFTGKHKHV